MCADILAVVIVLCLLFIMCMTVTAPNWRIGARKEFHKISSAYGRPYYMRSSPGGLALWRKFNKNCPFIRLMVVDECVPHEVPDKHCDFIYTTIKYHIDTKKYMDIMAIADTIMYDKLKDEVTVRGRNLEENMATLVLIDKIHSDVIKLDAGVYKKYMDQAMKSDVENYRTLQCIKDKHDYKDIDYSKISL